MKEAYGLKGVIKEEMEREHIEKLDEKKKRIYKIYKTKQFSELKDIWKQHVNIELASEMVHKFEQYPEVKSLYLKLLGKNQRIIPEEKPGKLSIID